MTPISDKTAKEGQVSTASRAPAISAANGIDAVIFDMDGVVTDTAQAHAAAWKRLFDEFLEEWAKRSDQEFEPFDAASDYRAYVDGKPRYEGVKSFLQSRGIDLPFGDPSDDAGEETICGLGNRKDLYFHAWLDHNKVQTYPGTIRLLRVLRAAGIKTGIFTSSRNAKAVLANAGVRDLFDARLDGNDLAVLGIAGKPTAAMLLALASRLDAIAERTAVVEDATAGVQAGKAGHFGLVVWVDRGDYGRELAAHGADIVVHDLAELNFDRDNGLVVKTVGGLPSMWDCREQLRTRLAGRTLAVFFDYDGTLTPIVTDPDKAILADDMRQALKRLAERCTVGIISGRDLTALKAFVGLDSVLYAGSHGFDIDAPGRLLVTVQKGEEFLPDLDVAEQELRQALRGVAGHGIERKRFAVAVHYRQAADADVARVETVVDGVVDGHPRLRKGYGKKVFEVRPRTDWHKGRAVAWLLEQLDLDREDVLPIFIGDDLTDEDGFRALAGRGIAIAVGDEDRATAADYRLTSTDDVRRFLSYLVTVIDGGG